MTISSIEARELMVRNLKLALHGPDSETPADWPGFSGSPIVVSQDAVLATDTRFDKPIKDEDGNDVLSRPPAYLYGIGVLYPKLDPEMNAILDQEQRNIEDADPEQSSSPSLPNDLTDSEDTNADEDPPSAIEVKPRRPSSMAVSIHLPLETELVTATVSGAIYEPIAVFAGTTEKELWRRKPIEFSIPLDLASQERHVREIDSVKLIVGFAEQKASASSKILTVFIINETDCSSNSAISKSCFFQAQMTLETDQLLEYPRSKNLADDSEASFALLYRNIPVRSVGHGCDTKVVSSNGKWRVSTDVLPIVNVQSPSPDITDVNGESYSLGMLDLAHATESSRQAVSNLFDDYENWIESQATHSAESLSGEFLATSERHLSEARNFLADMREGWQLVHENQELNRVFRWTCAAMNAQRIASGTDLREPVTSTDSSEGVKFEQAMKMPFPDLDPAGTNFGFGPVDETNQGYWRPFQLAFLLASVPALLNDNHPSYERVDIIWMPTGGGKTEAYLGLAAMTILWTRRMEVLTGKQPDYRVIVMMRYTLRLLTTQQVQRAAAMICALEVIRQTHSNLLDNPEAKKNFRIGAWLGSSSTPNTWEQAVKDFDAFRGGRYSRTTFLLSKCPWCGAAMGRRHSDGVLGYEKKNAKGKSYIAVVCPDSQCPFSGALFNRLPVFEVDEDIYINPPAFLVGTIDKFATVAWTPKSRSIFGLGKGNNFSRTQPPPNLLIQDELHLIAGPLGSMSALYEIAIERLCLRDGGKKPRIVAATATTKNYESQVSRLYGRDGARLLPPSGTSIEDNFFAKVPESKPGKTYVAICAPGLGTVVEAQLRVVANLAHGASAVEQTEQRFGDAWWTNLTFFSSRRSLGLLLSASQVSLRNHTYALVQRSGVRTGKVKAEGARASVRPMSTVRELTATSADNVSKVMADLELRNDQRGAIDMCFATSMIEVGVDVGRLGLMTVMGQPKSASQYIQVTGRVGRNDNAPGLVVVVLSPYNVRDRSHFENFRNQHERLYESVESVSVTPFTTQSLSRSTAGVLSTVLRSTMDLKPSEAVASVEAQATESALRTRALKYAGDDAVQLVATELTRLKDAVQVAARQSRDFWADSAGNGIMTRAGTSNQRTNLFESWVIPMSMRSVDLECGMRVIRSDWQSPQPTTIKNDQSDDSMEDIFG